ncbi:MAG: type II toxin-antitoxin system VapC family toxin [Mucilaginibacter sp.]|uniref:type II toxin-antitoxin system VapC family toxin n=1 Tax=Mucilaginibacter sp. TaxID=1882438 RepID=UPI0034E3877A
MKVLLDTHALIWFVEGVNRLSLKAKLTIEDLENVRFVSIASLWEIVIKSSLNKIEMKKSFEEINSLLFDNDIQILQINVDHLNTLLSIPHHHKDPFDRMLIAQAIAENISIISIDQQFKPYTVNVIW